jgi:outer membrane protein OmpA-like peptidoglycan-associated protein
MVVAVYSTRLFFHLSPVEAMRYLAPLIYAVFLTGCTSNVSKLRDINPPASDFSTSLASEYKDYAISEAESGRGWDAERYARKGLNALEGKAVEPDDVSSSLPPQHRQELADARAQLMKVMTEEVKDVTPQQLARAQLLFDCWQHQLIRDLNQEIAPCGAEFQSTFSQLQEVADPLLYGSEVSRSLTFEYKKTSLSPEHQQVIKDVAEMALRLKSDKVQVRAYIGKKASQRKLTETRLSNVRRALIKAGMPERMVRVKKDGSAKAVILSGDNHAVNTKLVTITISPSKEP